MQQESRLSIVVDTSKADRQIQAFNQSLVTVESHAKNLESTLKGFGGASNFSDLSKGIKSVGDAFKTSQSSVRDFATVVNTAKQSVDKLQNGAKQRIVLNGDASSLTQSINAASEALRRAQANAGGLTQSFRLVNTGLQTNAQFLAQANRALLSNSDAATNAKLNQDKLAISASKVSAAQSNAAAASTKAQQATVNLAAASARADAAISGAAAAAERAAAATSNSAAAASRAAAAVSNEAAARERAIAAASRTAAAAANEAAARERANAAAARTAAANASAAAAQDRAALAAMRLAAAEAKAAADAERLAGGLGVLNLQARGLMATITSLHSVMAGGLFGLATLGVLKTADEMQGLNSQIKIVTNSTEEYLAVREQVRNIANANYSDVSATTNLYQKSARALSNLGKSQKDALDFTNAVALAMRTGGRSAQEQASAILQLGQAMGANVVQGDEFRSIAENAPVLLDLVAKRLDVLPGQLKKMAADGLITGEIMFDAMTQNVSMLEEMAAKMPITMSQAFTVAKNQYKVFVDGIMNDTDGASAHIASAIGVIGQNFGTIATIIGAVVVVALTNYVGGMVAATVATSNLSLAALNLNGILAINAAQTRIVNGAQVVWAATTRAATGATGLLSTAVSLGVVGSFRAAAINIKNATGSLFAWSNMTKVASGGTKLLTGVTTVFTGTLVRVGAVINAHPLMFLATVLIGIVASTKDANGEMLGLMGAMDSLGDAISIVGTILGEFINFAVSGFGSVLSTVGTFISGFVSGSSDGTGKSTNLFSGFFEGTRGGFVGMLQVAARIFDAFGVVVYSAMQKAINHIINLGIAAKNTYSSVMAALGLGDGGQTAYRETNFSTLMGNRYEATAGGALSNMVNGAIATMDTRKARQAAQANAPISVAPMSETKLAQHNALKAAQAAEEAEKARKKAEKEAGKSKAKKKDAQGREIPDYLEYNNQWGTRKQRLHPDLEKKLAFLENTGIVFQISSGGQPAKGSGGKRTGSTGHDNGWAGDGRFIKDGRALSAANPNDLQTLKLLIAEAAANGITGIGTDYMGSTEKAKKELFHLGVQKNAATWGKGETSKNSPAWLKEAFAAGRSKSYEKTFLGQHEAEVLKADEKLEDDRLELVKKYSHKRTQIQIDLDDELKKIRESSLTDAQKTEFSKTAEADAKRELDEYYKKFKDEVDGLLGFKQSVSEKLKAERSAAILAAESDKELSRPENSDWLKYTKDAIEEKYEFDRISNELAIAQQKDALDAFRRTEREQLIIDNKTRLAEAYLMYDDLRDYRIEKIKEANEYDLAQFDLAQEQKLLEVQKGYLSEVDYIKQKYLIEERLREASNDSPEIKNAQEIAANKQLLAELDAHEKEMRSKYDEQTRGLYGGKADNDEALAAWEAQNKLLDQMLENGYIKKQEYYERQAALDEQYQNTQHSILLSGYQNTFGTMGNLLKAFGLEQKGAYRAMIAVEKGFAFAQIFMANKVALAKAWSSAAFPYNLVAVGKTLMTTGLIEAAISSFSPKGFKTGGYTGNGGVNNIAGVVHGQEYVFDAQATKRIGVNRLEAIRSGTSNGGGNTNVTIHNYTGEKVEQRKNENGDLEVMIGRQIQKQLPQEINNPYSGTNDALKRQYHMQRKLN